MIIDESFILLLKVGTWPAPSGFYGECRFHYMNNNWKFLSHTEGYVEGYVSMHVQFYNIYINDQNGGICRLFGFEIFVHPSMLDLVESPL